MAKIYGRKDYKTQTTPSNPDTDFTGIFADSANGGKLTAIHPDGSTQSLEESGGGGGAFSTTSNVTSNAPGTLATDDFVFGSDSLDDDGNADHDSRMFFDKSKAAFRAGTVIGVQWNEANIGDYSASFGYNNLVSGGASFSMGYNNNVTGSSSASIGYQADVSGGKSMAIGDSLNTSSDSSLSVGRYFLNNQKLSIAVGSGLSKTSAEGTAVRLEADADQDSSRKKAIYLGQTTAPATTTDRLYNVAGALTWNGKKIANETNSPVISTGTTTPTSTPTKVGDIYIDTTNTKVYIATGNTGSGDWTAIN